MTRSLFRDILVPHDFSSQATVALKTAAKLAEERRGTLTVLHVLVPFYMPADVPFGMPAPGDLIPEHRQLLERLVTRVLGAGGPPVTVRVPVPKRRAGVRSRSPPTCSGEERSVRNPTMAEAILIADDEVRRTRRPRGSKAGRRLCDRDHDRRHGRARMDRRPRFRGRHHRPAGVRGQWRRRAPQAARGRSAGRSLVMTAHGSVESAIEAASFPYRRGVSSLWDHAAYTVFRMNPAEGGTTCDAY